MRKMLRNERLVTRLNGEHPFAWNAESLFQIQKGENCESSISAEISSSKNFGKNCEHSAEISESSFKNVDNPVSNQIQPRKQPGLYMIRCIVNDMRYYGESKNVSGRLASHKSYLRRQIHPCRPLQNDWNIYKSEHFEFVVLFMGPHWENRLERQAKETLLIIQDRSVAYNYLESIHKKPEELNPFWGRKHSEETKKRIGASMRGVAKDLLGKAIQLDGVIYPSIAKASSETGHARKTIRMRINDPNDPHCFEIQKE